MGTVYKRQAGISKWLKLYFFIPPLKPEAENQHFSYVGLFQFKSVLQNQTYVTVNFQTLTGSVFGSFAHSLFNHLGVIQATTLTNAV